MGVWYCFVVVRSSRDVPGLGSNISPLLMCRDVKHNLPCGSYLQLQLQPSAKGGTGDTLASYSCVPDPEPMLSHDGNVGKNILYANGTIRTGLVRTLPLFLCMQSFPFFNPVQITGQEEVFSICFLSLFMCLRHRSGGPRGPPQASPPLQTLCSVYTFLDRLSITAARRPHSSDVSHFSSCCFAVRPFPRPTTLLRCHVYGYSPRQRLTCIQLQRHYLQLPQFFLSCYCFTLPSLLTCCSPSLLLHLS